ncbi:MAG TPA: ABC transporter ATP-binding protein [Longimicrobiales bacterium]|jgi:ABC-type multidrug transport system ATPase subunit
MLRAIGVSYSYGSSPNGVHDADLAVAKGEVIGLVGPNGAGKSTLLRLLDGQMEPQTGRVERPPPRTAEGRVDYGFTAEETPHFESLSGLHNALFFARAAGLDRTAATEAVERLFERLALSEHAALPVAEYSFGARRKLALVEAMAHDPSLLLLDEPTLGLDAESRTRLAALLAERAHAGTGIVLSSHDAAFVEEVAHHVVFIVRGRTRRGGRPDELIEALDGAVNLIFNLSGPLRSPPEPRGPDWTVIDDGNPIVVRAERGQAALPEVSRALLSAGADIREVHVREPGLGDAFRRIMGEELGPPPRGES